MDGRTIQRLAFLAFVVWIIYTGHSAWWILAGVLVL